MKYSIMGFSSSIVGKLWSFVPKFLSFYWVSEFEKVSYLIPIINIIYWVGEGDYCNEFSGQKTCNTNAYYVNLLINVNYGEGE